MQLAKTTAHDVLKEGGRGGPGSVRTRRWTSTLVVAELALTIVLLAGAGLLVRSALVLHAADGIVDSANVMTARLSLPAAKFPTPAQRASFYGRLDEHLQGISSIASSALATTLPFIGATPRQLVLDTDVVAPVPARMINTVAITDGYFHTLGLPILRGRTFEPRDGVGGQQTVIVNERFVAQYSADAEPIGRRVRLGEPTADGNSLPWLTIVGVSPSLRPGPMADVTPMLYVPLRGTPAGSAAILVRAPSDRAAVSAQLRDVVRALDADVALYNVMPLERLSQLSRWAPRVMGSLLALIAGIALFLSAMGLYAVTAYGVAQRTAEIGIRMALGARRSHVLWLFLRGTLFQLAIGTAIGMAGAIAVGQLLRGLLVRTSPLDPVTFVGIVLALIGVAVVACLAPARRAVRLDPVTALRHE
jgi:predicted permease